VTDGQSRSLISRVKQMPTSFRSCCFCLAAPALAASSLLNHSIDTSRCYRIFGATGSSVLQDLRCFIFGAAPLFQSISWRLWCTPKMVRTTSRGTPKVVYTQNGLHHEAWFTPSAAKSGPYHELWFTPKVVHTISNTHWKSWWLIKYRRFIDHPKDPAPSLDITCLETLSSLKTLCVYIHSSHAIGAGGKGEKEGAGGCLLKLELAGWASTNRDRPWLEGPAFIEGWTYEVRDRP